MPVSVTLPALGESVTEGTVTRWLKKEGDTVAADEPLLEISTDKVDTEIPAPASGVLLKISVAEDETVAVGAELAVIGEAGESASGAPARPADAAPAAATAPEPPQRPRPPPHPAPMSAAPPPAPRYAPPLPAPAAGAAVAPRCCCRRSARASPRGRSSAGSSASATQWKPTSRCWRSPPTRSTPRSRPRPRVSC